MAAPALRRLPRPPAWLLSLPHGRSKHAVASEDVAKEGTVGELAHRTVLAIELVESNAEHLGLPRFRNHDAAIAIADDEIARFNPHTGADHRDVDGHDLPAALGIKRRDPGMEDGNPELTDDLDVADEAVGDATGCAARF